MGEPSIVSPSGEPMPPAPDQSMFVRTPTIVIGLNNRGEFVMNVRGITVGQAVAILNHMARSASEDLTVDTAQDIWTQINKRIHEPPPGFRPDAMKKGV